MIQGVSSLIYSTFVTQAVGACILVLLFLGFHRYYRKPYWLDWCMSWAAFAIYLSAGAVALFMSQLSITPDLRRALGFISLVAGFVQIGYLGLGTSGLVRRTPPSIPLRRAVIALSLVFSVLLHVVSLTLQSDETAYAVRIGGRSAVAGLAFVAAGIAVFRSAPGMGRRLTGVSFTIYGLEQLNSFASTLNVFHFTLGGIVAYLGFADIVLHWLMGLGMVVSLLEDERATVERASQHIHDLAYHDALTGLPNRLLLADRLEMALGRAKRESRWGAVCYLDLDGFKVINDSLGHPTGDRLLIEVANRLKTLLRQVDTLSRVGGDEFTAVIAAGPHQEDVEVVARKLVEVLRAPFQVDGRELFVTASVGVSVFPTDADDAATLMRNADAAMYRAKEDGRDCFRMYTAAMNARALERLRLEGELRQALRRSELRVHYQPIFDLRKSGLHGVEALVRWAHPERGLLPPGHFIALAEQSGLIDEVGRFVMEDACRQARQWIGTAPDLTVSVNLSTRQFLRSDAVEMVSAGLRSADLPARNLELEITESVAIEDLDRAIEILKRLRELGVRVSLDDFGTGQSSLSHLQKLPIDALKIDRSFVSGLSERDAETRIVESVILLGHGLGLEVVAEGVEKATQLKWLGSHGCDLVQGHLTGRPEPPESISLAASPVQELMNLA